MNKQKNCCYQPLIHCINVHTPIVFLLFTDTGFLTTTIERAHWMSHDDGSNCNKPWRYCNLYVKTIFDDGSTFTTEKDKSSGRKGYESYIYPAHFHKKFKSGEIRGNSPVKIEIWSSPWIGSDSLLNTWNTNVNKLLKNGRHSKDDDNWIETSSVWKDRAAAII